MPAPCVKFRWAYALCGRPIAACIWLLHGSVQRRRVKIQDSCKSCKHRLRRIACRDTRAHDCPECPKVAALAKSSKPVGVRLNACRRSYLFAGFRDRRAGMIYDCDCLHDVCFFMFCKSRGISPPISLCVLCDFGQDAARFFRHVRVCVAWRNERGCYDAVRFTCATG